MPQRDVSAPPTSAPTTEAPTPSVVETNAISSRLSPRSTQNGFTMGPIAFVSSL